MKNTFVHNISKGLLLLALMSFLASTIMPYYSFNVDGDICMSWDFSDSDSEEKKETDKKEDKIRSNEQFIDYSLSELTLVISFLSNFYLSYHFEVVTPPPEYLS